MNTDNIDRFGHCVKCHLNLLTKRVVDNKVIDMFLPIYNTTDFILDNGSKMTVTICTPCKNSVNLNEQQVHSDIMEAVQKGWQLETKIKQQEGDPSWSEDKRKEYLDKMAILNIDCHCGDMSHHTIQEKQFELAGIKFREIEDEKAEKILKEKYEESERIKKDKEDKDGSNKHT